MNDAPSLRSIQDPTWNETFTTDLLRKAEVMGLTVWHDATIPPDAFVANCSISLADLIDKEDQPLHDLWVSQSSFPFRVKVARWQNWIPSFPWNAPGGRAWGRNPRL